MTVHATSVSNSILHDRGALLRRVETVSATFLEKERVRWAALDEFAVPLIDAVIDLVRAGGKRIRPEFNISGYLAAGGDPADPGIVGSSLFQVGTTW